VRSIAFTVGLALLWAPALRAATALHAPEPQRFEDFHRLLFGAEMPAALASADALVRDHPNALAPRLHRVFALAWAYLMDRDRKDLAERCDAEAAQLRAMAEARLKADRDDADALYHAGMAAHYQSRIKGLKSEWWGAVSAGRAGRALLKRALEADPGLVDARLGLGVYDIALDVLPSTFEILRVILFLPGGDQRRGMRELRAVMREGTCERNEARLLVGAFALELEHDRDESQRIVGELVRDYPDNPWFTLWRATQLQVLHGDSAAALGELDRVDRSLSARNSPFDRELKARAAFERASALFEQGRIEEAEGRLQELMASGVQRPFVVVGSARWLLARILSLRGNLGAAQAQARELLAIDELKKLAQGLLKQPPAARWAELDREAASARRRAQDDRRAAEQVLAQIDQRLGANPVSATLRAGWRLSDGDLAGARTQLGPWREAKLDGAPPWTKGELLYELARLAELEGERKQARKLYEQVLSLSAPADNVFARSKVGHGQMFRGAN
jgi:tetratricopeptide (TPR) repeat protein